jgi:hypothetical protein
MTCATGRPGPARLRVTGLGASLEQTIDGRGQPVTLTLLLPPGELPLTLTCDARRLEIPTDSRTLVFRVMNLVIDNVRPAGPRACGGEKKESLP